MHKGHAQTRGEERFHARVSTQGSVAMPIVLRFLSLDLGDDAAAIMAQFYRATDLLMPINSASDDLRDVQPSLSARWEFRRFDRPDVQYRIDMKRSLGVEEVYEITRETWTRIDGAHTQKPLEAILVRLDG